MRCVPHTLGQDLLCSASATHNTHYTLDTYKSMEQYSGNVPYRHSSSGCPVFHHKMLLYATEKPDFMLLIQSTIFLVFIPYTHNKTQSCRSVSCHPLARLTVIPCQLLARVILLLE